MKDRLILVCKEMNAMFFLLIGSVIIGAWYVWYFWFGWGQTLDRNVEDVMMKFVTELRVRF